MCRYSYLIKGWNCCLKVLACFYSCYLNHNYNYASLVVESASDVNILFMQYFSYTFSRNFSSFLSSYSHVRAIPFSVYPQPSSIAAAVLKSLYILIYW